MRSRFSGEIWLKQQKAGVEPLVRFEENDMFRADLREATVVTLLLTSINLKLLPKLLRELKPRTRIVSQTFDMGDRWKPNKTATVSPGHEIPHLNPRLFLWIIPRSHER